LANLSRRKFIRLATTLAGSALVVAGLGGIVTSGRVQAPPSSSSNLASSTSVASPTAENFSKDYADFLAWLATASKKVTSKRLTISLESEFTPLAVQRRDEDFSSATGITDGYNLLPYQQQLATVQLMTSTQSPTYDVFSVDNQNLGVFNKHMISPYDLAARYPEITYQGLDYPDFDNILWKNVATYPAAASGAPGGNSSSNVFLLPFDTPTMIFFYRKDIYAKLGLVPPKTWDGYFENAKTIKNSSQIGFACAAEATANISVVYEYVNHLTSFGGKFWEVDGNHLVPAFDSDAAVAALDNFIRFQPYADPGSAYYTWTDVFTSLAKGLSATGILWHDYAGWLSDPARTLYPGLFGYAQVPAGPRGSFSTYGGAGVGVSKYSHNPDAAWLWMQWATAKGTAEALVLDTYHILPTRQSVLAVPGIQAALQQETYTATKLAQQLYASDKVVPLIGFPAWLQVLDVIAGHLHNAWVGLESSRQALSAARQGVEQLGPLSF
jgi:multiple sugar transport system substrate-binding protein